MYAGKDERGLLNNATCRCSILFFLQNSSSFPSDEKQITLQSSFNAVLTMVSVSTVFPDTLVATTNVLLSVVFVKSYLLTTVTCIGFFDKTDKKISPKVPDPPIPANIM